MDKHSENSVFILVPVYNRRETSLKCLHVLCQTGDLDRFQVVVIDDGSIDGTGAAIVQQYPQVTVHQGDGTLWWTGAIKKGMKYAYQQGADYFIWLNDDCRVSAGTIADLIAFCQEKPDAVIGAQGFEMEFPDTLSFGGKRKTWRGYRFLDIPAGNVISCDMLSGNLVCLPRTVVDAVGYPNPDKTPHYGGDSMYLLRLQKAGFGLYLDSRHLVYNDANESYLCPSNWAMSPGGPFYLMRLACNPYSALSWRLWWQFNQQAYGAWGIVMFLKKYISLLPLTIIRLLPLKIREHYYARHH
ncbi:MAG: glycosyltransferase family 2 protein [Leptolyngbyaceae cyanobacterium]